MIKVIKTAHVDSNTRVVTFQTRPGISYQAVLCEGEVLSLHRIFQNQWIAGVDARTRRRLAKEILEEVNA